MRTSSIRPRGRIAALGATAIVLSFGLAACGSSDSGRRWRLRVGSKKVGVSLITKDSTNPFFVAMQKGAKADAKKDDVSTSPSPQARRTATRPVRSRPSRTRSPAATRAS